MPSARISPSAKLGREINKGDDGDLLGMEEVHGVKILSLEQTRILEEGWPLAN